MERRRLALVACAAIVVAGALLWLDRFDSRPLASTRDDHASRAAASEAIAPTSRDAAYLSSALRAGLRASVAPDLASGTRPQPRSAPLPPRDARIVEVFDELDERAERGDVAAACRLGFDLSLCRERERMRRYVEFFIDSGAKYPSGTEGAVDIVRQLEAKLAHAAQICDGLPAAVEADAWRHLARAGNLGDPRSASRFAGYPPIEPIDDGSDPEARRYRADHGARLMRAAFEAGDPAALFKVQRQYAGLQPGFDPRFVEPDRVLAAAYAMVLRSISDVTDEAHFAEQVESARAELPPPDFDRAVAISEAYRTRHRWPETPIDFASGIYNGYDDSTHCETHASRPD